jgi:uncharacterized glyoxalase superfamily protein PhnB
MSESPTSTTSTQTFYPAMRYADARAAIAWLARAFGFEEHVCYAADDGSVAHAQISFGGGLIMLGSTRDDDYPVETPAVIGGLTGSVYVAVPADEIDAHYARATAAGARLRIELHDTDYGSREYSAYDPEGHLWSFGTYRP